MTNDTLIMCISLLTIAIGLVAIVKALVIIFRR